MVRLVERRGLEPAGGVDDSAPGADVDDPLNRVHSSCAVPVGPTAPASAGDIDADAAHLPTAAESPGDLARGMPGAAANAGEHPAADLDLGRLRGPDAHDRLAGPVARLPGKRTSW